MTKQELKKLHSDYIQGEISLKDYTQRVALHACMEQIEHPTKPDVFLDVVEFIWGDGTGQGE